MPFDLSIIIPARNEEWLQRTVADVLVNTTSATEVIVISDGDWPKGGLDDHDRLTMIKTPSPIGQRAAVNMGIKASASPYVMKLDAHCRIGPNFDVALLAEAQRLGPTVAQVPGQYNLHAFDWVCDKCGNASYQGPTPTQCTKKMYYREGYAHKLVAPICEAPSTFSRRIVWAPREGETKYTTSWRFDSTLHFQYWGKWGDKFEHAQVHDTMSCLGACWMVDRAHFIALGLLDEAHGSWGQMGTEIACKYWLSGGRLVVNKRTWYAHLFRTQGGDFGFPYPNPSEALDKAKAYSQWLWKEGNWLLAKHTLHDLVTRFNPPGWKPEEINALSRNGSTNDQPTTGRSTDEPGPRPAHAPGVGGGESTTYGDLDIGAVYYTDGRLDKDLQSTVFTQLRTALGGRRLVTVGLDPLTTPEGDVTRILHDKERGVLTMFEQILAGLEALDTEFACLVEHDVLYHPSHFDSCPNWPKDFTLYYYNTNTWKVDAKTGKAVTYFTQQTSGLCARTELLIDHYQTRVELVKTHGFTRAMGFEPGTHNRKERVDDFKAHAWQSEYPNIDIRHKNNLTPSRWRQDQFRDQRNCRAWKESDAHSIPGWPNLPELLKLQ